MPQDLPPKYGQIVDLLLKEGYLTEKQIDYAMRVASKLEVGRPLLDILKELDYVTDEQVSEILRKNRVSMRIGSLLVELGYLKEKELQSAFDIQSSQSLKKKIGEILVEHNFIKESTFIEILSLQLGFLHVEPEFSAIDSDLFAMASSRWYDEHPCLPIRKEGENVVVVFIDPLDEKELSAARRIFGNHLLPAIANRSALLETIKRLQKKVLAGESIKVDDKTTVGIVNALIMAAVRDKASDIHIEPLSDRLRVRFRQDGVLLLHKDFPLDLAAPITSRIKIMCEVDITEKRRHQGGRLQFDQAGEQLDIRASFFVTIYGEKIVLRILNRQGQLFGLDEIGMAPNILERFKEDALDLPSGVVLITGPTGSGKTSTVYSCINYLNNPQTSIITAEEPVEYVIDGISQCSINPKIQLTFEETLRHIVRQDPDVIVIGEIRDNYSAEVAVQAALTGHKVLTTFHTEDSIGGLIRLLNMGIEAFLISSTVVSVVAQRLMRRVCPACKIPFQPTTADLHHVGYKNFDQVLGARFFEGRGCSQCRHTGYKGRVAVFELLVLDEQVRNAIIERKTSHEIRRISLASSGLVTLQEHGIARAANGETTLAEVRRCLPRLYAPRPLPEIRRALGE
ncbi:MAG: ATPase, T2SS/T4P/T4SS family [Desulfobulbaceae bacterium]|nr:ATPase, T2SS/T4P/T4SS family [Desulfobulbaceae bacterium]HIJ79522.1 Flp pilus assembly complex ATPase component TadA [Deltaproteobacteria bacterium]